MTLEQSVHEWLDHRSCGRIVAAVSGGADSTALLVALAHGLSRRGERPAATLCAAHFNHRLRGEHEHEHDLQSVRALTAWLGVPLLTADADPGEIRRTAGDLGGLEASARSHRYRFLKDAAAVVGARYLCTGHNLDDQVETILMRLLAGVEGVLLSGMPDCRRLTARCELCRPLLGTTRSQIDAFLDARTVRRTVDPSNERTVFRRNLVRHEIIPAIETAWPALRRDIGTLGVAMNAYHAQVRRRADSLRFEYGPSGARASRRGFYELDDDARLEALYGVMRRLGLLDRRNRPGHAFFAPVLSDDPGGSCTLVASRKTRIALDGPWLVVSGDVVRSGESGYLS